MNKLITDEKYRSLTLSGCNTIERYHFRHIPRRSYEQCMSPVFRFKSFVNKLYSAVPYLGFARPGCCYDLRFLDHSFST